MDPTTLAQQASRHYTIRIQDLNLTVRPRPRPCDDCGESVAGRTVTYALKLGYRDCQTWDRRCSECRLKTTVDHPLRDCRDK